MSFSSEVKNELARVRPEKKCCQLAEIAGFIRVSGSIGLAGGGKFNIIITSENPAAIRHYKTRTITASRYSGRRGYCLCVRETIIYPTEYMTDLSEPNAAKEHI